MARSATCTWPTTSGTRSLAGRSRRSSTGSVVRTSSTGTRSSGWSGRWPGCWTRPTRWPRRAGAELEFCESRPFGGTFVLDALWRRLGIDTVLTGLTRSRGGAGRVRSGDRAGAVRAGREPGAGPVLEAGRDADWVSHDVHIDGLARDVRRRLLPGDGLAASTVARRSSRRGVLRRSRTCSTSKSTCCSSTPPPPTSSRGPRRPRGARRARPRPAHRRRPATTPRAGPTVPVSASGRTTVSGSGPTASPRTPATTCPRS